MNETEYLIAVESLKRRYFADWNIIHDQYQANLALINEWFEVAQKSLKDLYEAAQKPIIKAPE